MQHTITTILSDELADRLKTFQAAVNAGHMDRETAVHRYLALQTACWMAGGMARPATVTTEEEAREEIRRFIREINRNATVQTMHTDGRRVALLEKLLEDTRPITKQPEQGRLL